ncbi:MAG: hypothetical protein AMXMBFR84_11970 [Candidatus Hydrogenedentota bacterium]
MNSRILIAAGMAIICTASVQAQGMANDLLAGKLVDPQVGQWAWYDLVAPEVNQKYVVRQAIVDEEKVGRKTGYWVEIEVMPEAGFRTVYKMLLTGPASDARNIHSIVVKQGNEKAREVPVSNETTADKNKIRSDRKSLGLEKVDTLSGAVQAEHIELREGDRIVHLWVNEQIKPTGIVKLRTTGGEMTLRNSGIGGDHAQSVITETPLKPGEAPVSSGPEPEILVE